MHTFIGYAILLKTRMTLLGNSWDTFLANDALTNIDTHYYWNYDTKDFATFYWNMITVSMHRFLMLSPYKTDNCIYLINVDFYGGVYCRIRLIWHLKLIFSFFSSRIIKIQLVIFSIFQNILSSIVIRLVYDHC